jgi:hypothetical protein
MTFDDRCGQLKKIFLLNQTAGAITVPAPRDDEPSGDGFYSLQQSAGGTGPKRLLIIPFGTAAANKTFTMEVIAWRKTSPHPTDMKIRQLWIAYPIAAFTCTLGAMTGADHRYVDQTQFFCDTIVAATAPIGSAAVDYNIRSPADDSVASVDIAIYGASIAGILFGVGSSEAVDANALIAPL